MAKRQVIGVDEVGRGAWAGPVLAGAVLLRRNLNGLADSKKLTKHQRQVMAERICKNGWVGLGWASASEVDKLGLSAAVALAMKRAVTKIIKLSHAQIIVDGNINYLGDFESSVAVIKADQTVAAVSAASVVAKVARDEYMATQARIYPGYGFEKHVGYGTALHRANLSILGPSDIHRLSYKPVKAVISRKNLLANLDPAYATPIATR